MADNVFNRVPCLVILLLGALALLPLAAVWLGQSYYITFATRVLVLAIAAVGLNVWKNGT